MTETRPTREELEAKAKELLNVLWGLKRNKEFALNVIRDGLETVARSARENAVERCAKIADGYSLVPGAKALHGMDIGKAVSLSIRAAFRLEEPDAEHGHDDAYPPEDAP